MKNDALIHLQIFYEIAMSIGNSLDLSKMLKSSLTVYLKKLSCTSGIIYQTYRHSDDIWQFSPQCAIPRNASKKPLIQNNEKVIPDQLTNHELKPFLASLPACGQTDKGNAFVIMELPGFGILILLRNKKLLNQSTIQSLIKINLKLAGSAIACQQNEKIEQINQKLLEEMQIRKKAEKAKSQFLANMSHELLTPINGIIGLNTLLIDSGLTDSQNELSDSIDNSAQILLQIFKKLFEFSKMEAAKLELQTSDFNIDHLVSSVIEKIQAKADKKGLSLQTSIHPDMPKQLAGDHDRIHQILSYLIDNAIKFTQSGKIILYVEPADSRSDSNSKLHTRFSVEDSGIGISDQNKKLLFETFTQADDSDTRKYSGIGLGLAICKKLVSLLDGQIEVTDSPADGSTFSVTLPLQVQKANTQLKIDTVSPGKADIHALIVDDNPVNRMVIKGVCKKIGWETTLASDGKQAVELMSSKLFDLVLMDCQMPVMDGYEATKMIRNPNSNVLEHDTPIIAVTANVSDENRIKCLKTGMDGFIPKPINLDKIKKAYQRIL